MGLLGVLLRHRGEHLTDHWITAQRRRNLLGLLHHLGAYRGEASSFGCYENPRLKREVCGGDFETTIKRSDFGMTFGVPFIPDDVKLLIQIEAIKQ